MDPRVMELRIRRWIPIIEEQAKSGMNKNEWCTMHGIDRTSFFRWQKRVREYLLNQCENQSLQLPLSNTSCEPDFVELSSSQAHLVEMSGQAGQCAGNNASYSCPPSISIRYGGFSIDLNNGADEEQLSTVLRAIKHAD